MQTDRDAQDKPTLADDSLIAAVPDLVAFIDRTGTIVKYVGGRDIEALQGTLQVQGKLLADLWTPPTADLLLRMVRRALKDCAAADGQFAEHARKYDVRVTPHGRERAMLVIRASSAVSEPGSSAIADQRSQPSTSQEAPTLERRAFAQRLRQSVADAALRERPLAVCMVYLDGLQDIAQVVDFSIADQILKTLLRRVAAALPVEHSGSWYVGQLGESVLTCVFEELSDRVALEQAATTLCAAVRQPVLVGDASFGLQPCAGVAILGSDARDGRALLEHARSAMFEARREGGRSICFYSDTLRLRPLARLDLERELRDAIAADQLALRYAARHDLETGERIALQSYLRWPHPLRGELRPSEFLALAENTGLAGDLSRWALARMRHDFAPSPGDDPVPLRLSFGALRHHLTTGALLTDLADWLKHWQPGSLQLELRISERSLAAMQSPELLLPKLAELGATVVIDEFGRHFSSMARLACLPIAALQIDRQFVIGSDHDPAAARLCRAVAALARELEIACFASGVDSRADRERLLALGIREGIGDCFGDVNAPGNESTAVKEPALQRARSSSRA
ncbi:MAG TPA: GGDEF domain-containing phosphodiesterase [Steroidobacteraceae bacterium]|nr:GGDEF domain-containing phosphodiesterase [Steroidobacteraceae bacterium]HRX88188.1 GGDEF domain-containing phosphodiesterase [Steroidobacteraceae bacterium]